MVTVGNDHDRPTMIHSHDHLPSRSESIMVGSGSDRNAMPVPVRHADAWHVTGHNARMRTMDTTARTGRRGNRPLEARMPKDERDLFVRLAEAQGTTAAELVRAYVRYHIGVPGADLPTRPEVTRDDLRLAVEVGA